MSSCPPIRRGSRTATLAALLLLVMVLGAPGAAAQPPLVAVPGAALDGQVRLVLRAPGGPLRPDAVTVAVDGVPQRADTEPVLSDRLALGLVVDASEDGSAGLPGGLSGAANVVLAVPPSTRSTLVTDATPPTVAVPWPAGPADTLRGLTAVRPGGARSTAAALELAVAQLPAGSTDPRIVVLYTGAPDAGGEPAPALAERMRSAGVLLAVVGTAGGATEFWSAVATGTGGVAVDAEAGAAIGAFDRVLSALDRTYLVTIPTPQRLPATATLRVETDGGPLTTEVAVGPEPSDPGGLVPVLIGAAVAVAMVGGTAVLLLRRRARGVKESPASSEARPRPPPAPRIWNIPARSDLAVDREPLLAELAATVHEGGLVWLRPHSDEAGLGLTSAMIDFAHRNRARYDIAWWIPALDPDLVPDRMAELAEALGLATPTDSADQATAALLEALSRRHRWLLVLDDAASPRELARYLPGGFGDVLIASADPEWRELASPVRVPAFTRAESVSLLRSGRPDLPAEPADLIADTLQDLPLAIGPVAALLADPGVQLDSVRAQLAGAREAGPATAAWTIALDRLAAEDPVALALLTLTAWLGPAPMPLALLTEHPHALPEPLGAAARSPSQLAEHAALLRRRGLARVSTDEVALHPVPAGLLIERTGREHAGDGGWTAIAVRLLRGAAPDRPAGEPGGWATWRRLLPHVLAATDPIRRLDVVAGEVGWLLAQAGGYLAARGRTSSARALLEDAHEFDVGARLREFGEGKR